MLRLKWPLAVMLASVLGLAARAGYAEGNGQKDLDEALRTKLVLGSVRDLDKVIELVESALVKGLDVENSDAAEEMLVDSLLQRAMHGAARIQEAPPAQMGDPAVQRLRGKVISDLRRVLEYDNPPAQAKLLLSQMLTLSGGDRPEALKLLNDLFDDKGVDKLPANTRAEALTLRAALQTEPEKALADFDAAIALEPEEPEHLMARAEFHRRENHPDAALADLDAVLKMDPQEARAYVAKAEILVDQKKLDEAVAILNKASELEPTAPGPYQQLGEVYLRRGDYPKAIEQFNKVLKVKPGVVLTLIYRAEAYLNNKQIDEALLDLETVLKFNPELPGVRGLRAEALAIKQRWPEAIEEMKQVAAAQPDEPRYRLQLALYYGMDKQYSKAIDEYSAVLKQDPKNQFALRGRANAYNSIGDHPAALKDFELAYAGDPKDENVLNNFAWILATSPEDAVRDGKRAIDLATQACEITEYKETYILSTLAAAYAESGDFAKAREWSQKAVDLFETQRTQREADSGKEATEKLGKELGDELAQYKTEKPWRERQSADDEAKPPAEKPASKPDATPATASAPAKPVSL